MKVRIGGIELVDVSWDELDELIERYGQLVTQQRDSEGSLVVSDHKDSVGGNGGGAKDRVVLDRLVEAGASGVPTQELGEILGRLGKSIRPGLIEWAHRVGLTEDPNFDPFDECRVGSRRGIRLKSSILSVAKQIQK